MGWVDFGISVGLRVPNQKDLEESIKEVLPGGKDPDLFMTPLDPDLEETEYGPYPTRGGRDPLGEEIYEECAEGKGQVLLWYNRVELDSSNGFEWNTNRCYSGGFLEFARGSYDALVVKPEHVERLKRIAEHLGVPFALSFSMTARGSSWYSTRFT